MMIQIVKNLFKRRLKRLSEWEKATQPFIENVVLLYKRRALICSKEYNIISIKPSLTGRIAYVKGTAKYMIGSIK
jgi:hypothetical protein